LKGFQVSQADSNKPDLLIVDDDPLITDTLNFVLSRDFSVYVAESRAQVKSLLRQLERTPQLALIDLGLPPTPHRPDEGFKLISELIAYSAGIKIVVLSGQSDEANARHARTLGAIEFVAKPTEPKIWKKVHSITIAFGHGLDRAAFPHSAEYSARTRFATQNSGGAGVAATQ
jgi:ActR/RegA family two-component response regulator